MIDGNKQKRITDQNYETLICFEVLPDRKSYSAREQNKMKENHCIFQSVHKNVKYRRLFLIKFLANLGLKAKLNSLYLFFLNINMHKGN